MLKRLHLLRFATGILVIVLGLQGIPEYYSEAATPTPTPPDSATGKIVYRDGASLYSINADGTGNKKLGDDTKYLYACPVWSRDGKQIAISGETDGYELYVMDANGNSQRAIIKKDNKTAVQPGPSLAWSSDGKQIALTSQGLGSAYITSLDGKTLNPLEAGSVVNLDWSPDGSTLVAFARDKEGHNGLYTLGVAGANVRLLLALPDTDRQISFSTEHYFTQDVVSPRWSPDGKQIAFASSLDGGLGIFVVGTDGAKPQRLTDKTLNAYAPTWSADGQYLAFASTDSGGQQGIFVMHSDGQGIRLLVSVRNGGCPAWNPAKS